MRDEDDLYIGVSEDHGDAVTAVAVSRDGRLGATGARSGEIRLWDLRHGLLTGYMGGLHDGPVENAAFIGDAKRPTLLTAGPSVSLWTVTTEALEWRQLPWDGGRLLTSSDQEAVLRQCGDLRWLGLFGPLYGRIKSDSPMALGRTGSGLIVVSSDKGRIEAWRRPPGDTYDDARPVWDVGGRDAADQRLTRCCDGWRLVVSPRRGRVVVLDAETGAAVTAFAPPARPTAIAAHPDRPLVVLGGRDGSLSWWDARSGRCLGRVQAHGGRIRALALATGTDLVMSVSQDGTAALWRLHGRGPVGRFTPPTPAGPRELTQVAGTPDGRCWLIGGRGGQVHVLHWSGHAGLVPQRVGRPSCVMDGGDVETLLDDIRNHWDDGPASLAAVRELTLGDLDKAWRATAVDALATLTVNGADPAAREAAAIALAEIDENAATTAFYRMFARHDGHGSAGRLLAYFTGKDESTTEELIASLPGIGNFLGVLTSATLGERGAVAVPAVHAALRALPFPTRQDTEHWFRDESTKYRLLHALRQAGAAAAPTTPTLLAVLEDEEIYRDTRHQAEVTLQAIGLPETADTIAAEIRRRADLVVHGENDEDDDSGEDNENGEVGENGEDDETEGFSLLLDVLLGMPPAALMASREVGPALEAVRRRFGDGIRTYEEDGEVCEYTAYEIRLADCIDEKIAEQLKATATGGLAR
ncbi:WD40 repeat domain-containing protein [Streptomyces sp. 3N207]|uniref:WD40 repeat domain-containing protein n=1 Tax=Streptomyces sp. 3N207 TaxID=3457417 RepID=UPI003FCFC095